MRLTDLSIKALKPPAKGVVYYTDETLTGFGVRVSEGGTKSYVLTYGARRQRITLGRVGVVSLQKARTAAKEPLTIDVPNDPVSKWPKISAEEMKKRRLLMKELYCFKPEDIVQPVSSPVPTGQGPKDW